MCVLMRRHSHMKITSGSRFKQSAEPFHISTLRVRNIPPYSYQFWLCLVEKIFVLNELDMNSIVIRNMHSWQ
jgi:hypothetical protein